MGAERRRGNQAARVGYYGSGWVGDFQVADGSTFEVFPNSKAIFRQTPGNLEYLLNLILGTVRVQIQHLAGQPNPNKVRTPTAVISVRGTIFDVNVIDDRGTTLVYDEEGHVMVRNELQAGDGVLLNPGDWIKVDPDEPLAARKPDYSALAQRLGRTFREIADEILMHSRTGGGLPGGTAGTGPAADKNGNAGKNGGTGAPPPPPSAPTPPPPPPGD